MDTLVHHQPNFASSTREWKKQYSRHAVEALATSLFAIPGVHLVGTFGTLENPQGTTANPKIILATGARIYYQNFAGFIQRNLSRRLKYDRGYITRAAATFTFDPGFQVTLAEYESMWCNNIGDDLEVYVLPINWPEQIDTLKAQFGSFTPSDFWDCVKSTAKLIGK